MSFLRFALSVVVALSLFMSSLGGIFTGGMINAYAATIYEPDFSQYLESLSFTKANGQLANLGDDRSFIVIQFSGSDLDGLGTLALNPEYTFKGSFEISRVVISQGIDLGLDDPALVVYHDYLFGFGGNWSVNSTLRQRQDLFLRIGAFDPNGGYTEEFYPLEFQRTDGDDPVNPDDDGEGIGPKFDPGEFIVDPNPEEEAGDPEKPTGPGEPLFPEDPFPPVPPIETTLPYDRPSEAQPGTQNPLFGTAAYIPRFYRFAFPRYGVTISNPLENPNAGRLMIGFSVNTELIPKFFLNDGDDLDNGLVMPVLDTTQSDPLCPSGKHALIPGEANDFSFQLVFQEPIQGLFVFMLDEDGDGDYNFVNALGNSEVLNVAFVGPGPGVLRHNFTTRPLADLSFAGDTGLYGRAVLVALDGTRLPPLDPLLEGSGMDLRNQLEAYLPLAEQGDDFVGTPGKTWSPFGDLMEGEAETYCFFVPGDEEFPSEPQSDYPRLGESNRYFPDSLSYDEDERFFLGDPATEINPVLVQQGKLDAKALTFENEPKIGKRVEPRKVQKVGDDRNGVIRRGFVRENLKRGELLFEVGRTNVIEVTATLLEGGDANADGERILYLNGLLDKQADGEYQGKPFSVERGASNDWAIQNFEIVFPQGERTVTFEVPFRLENVSLPPRGTYLRLMINESPARVDDNRIWNGSEDVFGESPMYGEAETYYVQFQPRRTTFDRVTAPLGVSLASLELVQSNAGDSDYDGDGIPDAQDTDTDGDGISDTAEGRDTQRDTDGYGVPDYLDPDADGDGLPDAIEGSTTAFVAGDIRALEKISDLDGGSVSDGMIENFVELPEDTTASPTGADASFTFEGARALIDEVERTRSGLSGQTRGRFNASVRPPKTTAEVEALDLVEGAGGERCLREGVSYVLNDISGHPTESYIRKGAFLGLVNGYQNQFRANDPLQRDQLAKIVAITLCLPIEPVATPTYSDVSPNDWSYEWVEAVTKAGIFQGFEGRYRPGDLVNRAEFFTVLARISELTGADFEALRAEVVEQVRDVDETLWYTDGVTYGFLSEGLDSGLQEFRGWEPMTRGEAVRQLIGHLMPFIGILE